MGDYFDRLDKKTVENAVDTAKSIIGEQDGKKLEAAIGDPKKLETLLGSLSPSDAAAIRAIISDPVMLRRILSSPQAREGLKKLFGG